VTAVLGIDVGGSKIAAGLVDPGTGAVQQEARCATPADGGAGVLAAAIDLTASLAAERAPIGIGICELVDPNGAITSADTIDWRGLDVAAGFADIGGPVRIESDVRAAARAEASFGAGRPYSDFLYISVGTGISYAHVLNGEPRPGARGNAIIVGAPPVEDVASGRALEHRAGAERAEDVLANPAERTLVEDAARSLGLAVAALVNAIDPEALVVGGGLGLNDSYRALVEATARPAIEAETTRALPIVPAVLGGRSGVVGAALAAV